MIIADFRNLRQVLNRLLSNSLKFTEVGKIELSCEKTADDVCLFMVRDTGCGIAAEKRDIIFNAFMQAAEATPGSKTAGTGLGLSIAKGLVELMNGKIWFESEAGKGSTFYFTIPYVKGKA
jgi:signal transduction histidine kinase